VKNPFTEAQSAAINRVLTREDWARERLATHATRVFALRSGPFVSVFRIDESGMLQSADASATPADLTLTLSPFSTIAFLAEPSRFEQLVEAHGDRELATTIKDLSQSLPVLVEQGFARVLGPVAGQRVADAGRAFLKMPGYAAERVFGSAASYLRDETGIFASRNDLRVFDMEVSATAARVDDLERRVDALDEKARAPVVPVTAARSAPPRKPAT
jgi:ubiquinone biosynthesis protein UbiJ